MEKWEVTGGLLKRIGDFNVNSWNDRVVAQKLVYLIQYGLGDNLRYPFNLYVHGPYSPQLADDLYKLGNTRKVATVRYKSKEMDEKFERFVRLLGNNKKNANCLELVATMIHIHRTQKIDESQILEKVKRLKPHFPPKDYLSAFKVFTRISKT